MIVVAFVIAWVGAFAIYKVRRIDERWAALVTPRRDEFARPPEVDEVA